MCLTVACFPLFLFECICISPMRGKLYYCTLITPHHVPQLFYPRTWPSNPFINSTGAHPGGGSDLHTHTNTQLRAERKREGRRRRQNEPWRSCSRRACAITGPKAPPQKNITKITLANAHALLIAQQQQFHLLHPSTSFFFENQKWFFYKISLFFVCRTMTAICFVCNLPILSHQVGLVWQGGNGWDDLVREQVGED